MLGDTLFRAPGGTVALGAYRADLAEDYWRWEQDTTVLTGLGRRTLPSPEEHAKHVRERAEGTLDMLRFTVYDATPSEPVPVGTCGVEVNWRWASGMFFIIIGPEGRGRGLGSEATRLTLDYAFHVANLECVHLSVFAPNARAIRAYEKAGFQRIGLRRRSAMFLGERVDELLMDALPGEFVGPSVVKERMAR